MTATMDDYDLNQTLIAAKCHGFPKYRNMMLDGKPLCTIPADVALKMARLWNKDLEKKTDQPI